MLISGSTRNRIGKRGEALCYTQMTRRVEIPGQIIPADGYLFEAQFLGEKWPFADYYVELQGADPAINPYFFVQVKTSTRGYTRRDGRLKVQAEAQKVQGLAAYPAPTYIVGIDEVNEQSYVVSANGENMTSLSSLSTAFPLLDAGNRWALWNEVLAYWQPPAYPKLASAFADPNWK